MRKRELPGGARNPRRRRPDRRRRPGRDVGGAAAGAAAEGAAAASRWRSRCSRRRARPARTCCRARCSIRRALRDLVPDFEEQGAPLASAVHHDHVYFLTRTGKVAFPITPPPLEQSRQLHHLAQPLREVARRAGRSRGHRRLHRVCRRPRCCTTAIASSASAPAIAASASTASGSRRSSRASTSAPRSRSSADGVRGNLTKALVRRLGARRGALAAALRARHQGAVGGADGPRAGRARSSTRWAIRCGWRSSAAGSSTRMPDGLAVGRVRRAGSTTAIRCSIRTSTFQHFKRHPLVAVAARGRADGALRRQGAARRRLAHDSARLRGRRADRRRRRRVRELDAPEGHSPGDADRACWRPRRAFDAVRAGDVSAARAEALPATRSTAATCRRELYPVRNVHQSFELRPAGGRGVFGPVARDRRLVVSRSDAVARRLRADAEDRGLLPRRRGPIPIRPCNPAKIDRQLTFDRLTNVHYSGTRHAEDQPSHLIVHDTDICRTRCREEYGNPCTRFCPANVYEMVDAGDGTKQAADQRLELRPLQDVRHHGSLPDHRLGAARGRRRAAVRRHVGNPTPSCQMPPLPIQCQSTESRSSIGDPRAALAMSTRSLGSDRLSRQACAAAAASPLVGSLGSTWTWRIDGARALRRADARRGGSRSWRSGTAASCRPRSTCATAASSSMTSQNFDGEWIARLMRAVRLSAPRAARRRAAARARWCSCGASWRDGRPAAFTVDGPRGPARVAQPGAVWLAGATGHPILPFHIEAGPLLDGAELGSYAMIPKPFSTVAVAIGEPIDVSGHRAGRDRRSSTRMDWRSRLVGLAACLRAACSTA